MSAAGVAAPAETGGTAAEAPDAAYRGLVEEAVLDERHFVRAVFSGRRRGHTSPWERVVLRPVEVRGRPHVQFTYHDAVHAIDRNRAGRAARDELAAALDLPFRSFFVELTDREVHATYNKRGEVAVRLVDKATPVPRVVTHDRQKRQPLPAGEPNAFLMATGIMGPDGRVRADRYDKFRQINEFVKLLDQLVSREDGRSLPDTVVDFGCGNAYLTFAAYHHLRERLGHPVTLCGVDVQGGLLESHRAQVESLGWEGLTFREDTIAGFAQARTPDLVLSLHACDTATDDALARAIRWESRYVLSVPCCHHDLQSQLRRREDHTPLRPVYRDGILAERLGDVLTDTLRALILRVCGYHCDVVQFISTEHTSRNVMIRATRTGRRGDPQAVAEYVRLRDFLGVTPHLQNLLGETLQEALHVASPAAGVNV